MRVTAIRIGGDLWQVLEAEAAMVGVSVSQYIREAALARAAAAAAARGEDVLELLGKADAGHGRRMNRRSQGQGSAVRVQELAASERVRARTNVTDAHERVNEAHAVKAQSQQVVRRRQQRTA
jgi:hypothetical protein